MNIDRSQEIPAKILDRIQVALKDKDEELIHYIKGEPEDINEVRCKITGDLLALKDEKTGRLKRTKNYTNVYIKFEIGQHVTPVSKRALPLSNEALEYLYCCDLLQFHSEDIVSWSVYDTGEVTGYSGREESLKIS